MQKKIDVGTLRLTAKHRQKVMQALKGDRLSYGPMTDEFEKRFSAIHHNNYGIFTNSGTSALEASIQALKILGKWNDGDEIIMPAVTFVATYNVILHNNLRPVLVDVEREGCNIDVKEIEKAITPYTRAIMPVHLLGKPADMDRIIGIAKKYKLKVIEDSCETMFVDGIAKADVSCFSFYIAHLLVTGVGGMAITNDKRLADLIRSLIFHGRDNLYLQIDDDAKYNPEVIAARFKFNYPGYSFRGTEMEAALGLVELDNYKEMMRKRKANAEYLAEHLGDEYNDNHAYMMYPYYSLYRDELMLYMEKKGITTRTVMPLISQPYIKKTLGEIKYPFAELIGKKGLLFGCHQDLTNKDLDYIVKTIKEFNDNH